MRHIILTAVAGAIFLLAGYTSTAADDAQCFPFCFNYWSPSPHTEVAPTTTKAEPQATPQKPLATLHKHKRKHHRHRHRRPHQASPDEKAPPVGGVVPLLPGTAPSGAHGSQMEKAPPAWAFVPPLPRANPLPQEQPR